MKIPRPNKVYADFECFSEPKNNSKLFFEQIPTAVGCYLTSPFGNKYYSYFGEGCVKWFVNEMLTLEKSVSECILKQRFH